MLHNINEADHLASLEENKGENKEKEDILDNSYSSSEEFEESK